LHPSLIAQVLALVVAANGAPILAKKVLGDRYDFAVDGGRLLPDGQPVFGSAKTIRGLVASLLVTALLAPAIGASFAVGALVAMSAMAGDLLSSFAKRRLGLPPSSMCIGVDQAPESLLPALACRWLAPLSFADIAIVVALFFVGELMISRLLFVLKIRDQPY
jgi:hypothetical protein